MPKIEGKTFAIDNNISYYLNNAPENKKTLDSTFVFPCTKNNNPIAPRNNPPPPTDCFLTMADSSLTMSYDETEQKVPTSHDVLNKLDSIANSLKHDWKGNISVELDKDSLGNLQFYNLCNHIGKYKYNCDGRYYFDTIEYPPPPPGVANIPKNDLTWNKLKLYIIRQSHDGGSPVSANDTNNNSSCKVCLLLS